MQMNKSIAGKLYLGFGLIMVIVVFAFIVNWIAVKHEQNTRELYKESISMVETLSKLDKMRNENRLYLRNFLLNGDRREADALAHGETSLDALFSQTKETAGSLGDNGTSVKQLLDQLADSEREWMRNFANPLMEKRRQVDTGSATVSELQIAYLQATPTPEQKAREEQPLLQLASIIKTANGKASDSDNFAALMITLVTGF